jgi:glucosamine-6-phosphate deaminase
MEVIIRPTAEQAADLVAWLIAARLRSKPNLVLGLATGRTMERVYDRLASIQRSKGLDFSHCRTFNLDEYIGIPAADERSYRYYMNHHLLVGSILTSPTLTSRMAWRPIYTLRRLTTSI